MLVGIDDNDDDRDLMRVRREPHARPPMFRCRESCAGTVADGRWRAMTAPKAVLGRNCQTNVNAARALGARRVSPLLPASWSRIGVWRGAVRNRAWGAGLARFATGRDLIGSANVATFGGS